MKLANKIKSIAAFTLIELVIVIAIISILATIVVIGIDPSKLFANSRNSQRSQDLSNIQTAIGRYLADSAINANSRSVSDFIGVGSLYSLASSGYGGVCAGGANGINSSTTITGSYDINTVGTNFIDVSILLNNGYLTKIPRVPSNLSPYQGCIDTVNNNQLVVFAPNTENLSSDLVSAISLTINTNIYYHFNRSNNSSLGFAISPQVAWSFNGSAVNNRAYQSTPDTTSVSYD